MFVRMVILALVTVTAIAGLAACGSGDKKAKAQVFRQCTSEHGITLPEPEKGNGGIVRITAPPPGVDPQAFQSARDACADK
ncbi:MAG: hypothetical protein J2P19_00255 [Pseudonocardia sp.]|nr:hypothetical protein [Pseudonocardia sp.]